MKILIPLPTYGFDPSEAAIPWKLLTENGFDIIFASPNGMKAAADKIMVTGNQLGILKSLLMARKDAVWAYKEMVKSDEFNHPIKYSEISEKHFDGLFLPGGHDKGVKEYLESKILQNTIVDFFDANKNVAAVCHGVILLARSIHPQTGNAVIYDYKTTALLKTQELLAYNLTKLWLKDYYLTYPRMTVEDEVTAALKSKKQFIHGAKPIFRDTLKNQKHGFIVRDRNYVSGRWPGDIYSLTLAYIDMMRGE